MDFFNAFKNLFGIPRKNPPEYPPNSRDYLRSEQPTENDQMGFNIYSNTLEIHKYFEQQLNEMLRSFGIPTEETFGTLFRQDMPMLGGEDNETQIENYTTGNLREQYLKPGYVESRSSTLKSDSDVDGRINLNEIDTVLKGEATSTTSTQPSQPRRHFFGQSMVTKTIVNPDGSIETIRTVKDHTGKEERTVSFKQGDQEYSVTTKRDQDGKTEKEETLVNMDEDDAKKLIAVTPNSPFSNNPLLFDFSRFFR